MSKPVMKLAENQSQLYQQPSLLPKDHPAKDHPAKDHPEKNRDQASTGRTIPEHVHTEKAVASVTTEQPASRKKAKKKANYTAVLTSDAGTGEVLEVIGEAAYLKQHYSELELSVLCEKELVDLMHDTGLFSRVEALNGEETLKRHLKKLRPALLHIPEQSAYLDLPFSLFGGKMLRIGHRSKKRGFPFSRVLDPARPQDLEELRQRGWEMEGSAALLLPVRPDRKRIPERSVWLNLKSAMDSAIQWSVGHAGRLARLLDSVGYRLVIPVCKQEDGFPGAEDIRYLNKLTDNIVFYNCCGLKERLSGLASSEIVISPVGAELALAGLVGRSTLVLYTSSQAKTGDSSTTRYGRFHFSGLSSYSMAPYSNEEDCDDGCHSCASGSCIDKISPESVFELLSGKLKSPRSTASRLQTDR